MKIVARTLETEEETVEKLFNFRPLFFAAVFLCVGVVFSYLRIFFHLSNWWMTALLPIAITPIFFKRTTETRFKALLATSALVLSFCVGSIAFSLQISSYVDCGYYQNTSAVVVGTVENTTKDEEGVWVTLKDVYIEKNKEKGKLISYLPLSFCENLQLADRVLLRGKVDTETDLFKKGEFQAYAIGDDIRFRLYGVESCVKTGRTFSLFAFIRQRIDDTVYAGMDETSAAVTMALLTGDASGIEKGLLENIRYGGIAHIFAVSGLHVGALYAFCLGLFKKTRLKTCAKPVRFVVMSALMLTYAGVCGFSASVVRATTICLSAYAASLIGTETDFLQSLGFAAIVVLLFSPTALFEAGFQLSFSACLGLALLSRPIGEVLQKIAVRFVGKKNPDSPLNVPQRIARAIVSFLSACLAAQLMTLPIQLSAFGYVSVWGLLLNCIFVPIISGVFAVLLAVTLLTCLLPTVLSAVFLYAPSVVWSAVLLAFEAFDFSSFAITGLTISNSASVCYYAGMQFLSDKWNVGRKQKFCMAVFCFVSFGIAMVVLNV